VLLDPGNGKEAANSWQPAGGPRPKPGPVAIPRGKLKVQHRLIPGEPNPLDHPRSRTEERALRRAGQTRDEGHRRRARPGSLTIDAMPNKPHPERVQKRADSLTPEEDDAGSSNPLAQAEEILADSDAREDRVSPPGKPVEHGQSDDNVEELPG
jgi:hypothetical protein